MLAAAFIAEAKSILGDAVITDPAAMAPYLTSMRNRHVASAPMIALPHSTMQVAALVKLCNQHHVALVPQGGNTGLVDGGIPSERGEVVISLSRMNAIRSIDATGLIATVEAGAVLHTLKEKVAEQGLMFPLGLASEGSAQIGGLISANAGGLAALRYGCMRNLVLGVEAVMPDGKIVSGLRGVAKDNTGYHFASWLIGAEGTLGIVTAATLRLLPVTRAKLTAMVAVSNIGVALELLAAFRREAAEHLSAFEFMSLAALQLAIKNIPGLRFPGNQSDAPYHLLIELSASSSLAPLRELFEAVASPAIEKGDALDAVLAENETQAAQFWRVRESIPNALRIETQRIHFDIALPVSGLADFVEATNEKICAAFPDVTLMPFGHLGDGNVHYNMFFSKPVPAFAATKTRIQDMVFGEVEQRQGSISAEHGVGVERKSLLAKIKPPDEIALMRAIKHALDPQRIMNPGKIFD